MNIEEKKQDILEYFFELENHEVEYKDFYRLENMLDGIVKHIKKQERNISRLINYIAVIENKDYEDVRREFDI